MSVWFDIDGLLAAQLPDLPRSGRGLRKLASELNWQEATGPGGEPLARRRSGKGGGWEYNSQLFPVRAQAEVLKRQQVAPVPAAEDDRDANAWEWFDGLTAKQRATAEAKLATLHQVEKLIAGQVQKNTAVSEIARETGKSARTIWSWYKLVDGVARANWLPALGPKHRGRTVVTECDPRAWDYLKSDYLRPEAPNFAACVRRAREAAAAEGWGDIPADKTLRRKLDAEVSHSVQVLARQGLDQLKTHYPAQQRDRSVFHALQAVNADGHKFDVFCKWPDGTIDRPMMVAIQDLHSGLVLGYRLDRTENKDAVRLAFGDVVSTFGIPEQAYLDNGRAFASKWLTGGQKTRFRFKVKADDPDGILTNLGVQVHWTTPYSGQSKPIERAFRDLAEEVAKHPICAGAYTGNRPDAKPENYGSKAIDFDVFAAHVAEQINRHNTRTGRRGGVCNGRSFQQTFMDSYNDPNVLITRASAAQQRLWLLAAEGVKARRPSGEIHLAGNRFWNPALTEFMGQKLVVRFDPDHLQDDLHVYTIEGRYLCAAECIEAVGFNDTAEARAHAQARRKYQKSIREQLEAERVLSLDDLVRLQPKTDTPDAPEEPNVIRLPKAVGAGGGYQDRSNDFLDRLGAGMAANVIDFTTEK